MRGKGTTHRDEVAARLAGSQHGVASRHQLLFAGIHRRTIDRSLQEGRLHPVFRGVYAVGHKALRREGWWKAALLACGEGAALSHRTAAILWGLLRGDALPVHVTTNGRGRKHRRVVVHRSQLHTLDVVEHNGLRVTTVARTIVDLAAALSPRELRAVIERAQDRRLFDPTAIAAVIARSSRRRGVRPLTDLLELLQPDKDNARSHLERLFIAAVRKARLPRPQVNALIAGRKRDFVWPEQRLVVEVDGYRWHSSRAAMRRDRYRDRQLTALGWRPVRFTYEDVAFEPAEVAKELEGLLVTGATH